MKVGKGKVNGVRAVTHCERCGKEIGFNEDTKRFEIRLYLISDIAAVHTDGLVCRECAVEFSKWFNKQSSENKEDL